MNTITSYINSCEKTFYLFEEIYNNKKEEAISIYNKITFYDEFEKCAY